MTDAEKLDTIYRAGVNVQGKSLGFSEGGGVGAASAVAEELGRRDDIGRGDGRRRVGDEDGLGRERDRVGDGGSLGYVVGRGDGRVLSHDVVVGD